MGMPKNLIFIRHGESEANVIQKAVKKDKTLPYPQAYLNTPDREFRLSSKGVEQTKATGEYLAKIYPKGVDIVYVSDHTRAKETAALVCLHAGWDKVNIKVDPQLGERHWGSFHLQDSDKRVEILNMKKRDPLHVPMPDGETLLETRNRTRVLLERCVRQHGNKNVLVFTHGEYIEAIWSEIAHMRTEEQVIFFSSDIGDIKNCQIIEFKSNTKTKKIEKVKSSNPHLQEFGDWIYLKSKFFSPSELLEEVNQYPNLQLNLPK